MKKQYFLKPGDVVRIEHQKFTGELEYVGRDKDKAGFVYFIPGTKGYPDTHKFVAVDQQGVWRRLGKMCSVKIPKNWDMRGQKVRVEVNTKGGGAEPVFDSHDTEDTAIDLLRNALRILEDDHTGQSSPGEDITPEIHRLRRERHELKKINEDLRAELVRAEAVTDTPAATADECRAAYVLGVGVDDLRRWAKVGVGPQPPYQDVEEWVAWVEAREARRAQKVPQ